jgi:hypothetical protein
MSKERHHAALAAGMTGLLAVVALGSASASQSAGAAGSKVAGPPAARNFVSRIDNEYLPWTPGTVYHYAGTKDGEPSSVTTEVTRETKVIQGVRCVVVHDTLSINGQPEERTVDWYAQDRQDNVWYFGEDSFDLVNGTWVKSDGSWQAGVDGAVAGIVMEGDPHVGDTYRQEYFAGHAEDMAQVLNTDAAVTVPYGSFDEVVQTKDWSALRPAVVENKFYAPGVGEVRSMQVQGGSNEEHLVSVEHSGGNGGDDHNGGADHNGNG